MSGSEHEPSVDWAAAARLDQLMSDRGLTPRDVERASRKTGHPMRRASYRVVYRVLSEGHKPSRALRYEIASALGLAQSTIWQPTDAAGQSIAPIAPVGEDRQQVAA